MEWHLIDHQSLAIIDQKIENHQFSPAEYEIIRRVIYYTADFEYQSLIHFSERALQIAAAAISARTPILVDVSMVQAGIVPKIQKTFLNPVYCNPELLIRSAKDKSYIIRGIQSLAKRYPEGIFIIGQDLTSLKGIVELIEIHKMQPTLIINTCPSLGETNLINDKLKQSQIPYITVSGSKGNAVVAVAIVNGLLDLAWQVYSENNHQNHQD